MTLSDLLAAPLVVGEPDVAGPLAVFPVFGPPPRLEYRSFAEASAAGARVAERPEGASVNDLVVDNPLSVAVLLYEGEELLGAQQNRVLDVSVLVAAGARVDVPVSCVEAGRWDGDRHDEAFAPAPQAAYPALRRVKNLQATHSPVSRSVQSEVWREVGEKAARMEVASPTGAMHDVFERRRRDVAELAGAIRRRDGQTGMVVAVGGTVGVCDVVSRADVFAALHGRLVQGYALDALEAPDGPPPPAVVARAVLHRACRARLTARPSADLGDDARFAEPDLHGSALVHDGELVALSAFATG